VSVICHKTRLVKTLILIGVVKVKGEGKTMGTFRGAIFLICFIFFLTLFIITDTEENKQSRDIMFEMMIG
jgi:hypothetical protein